MDGGYWALIWCDGGKVWYFEMKFSGVVKDRKESGWWLHDPTSYDNWVGEKWVHYLGQNGVGGWWDGAWRNSTVYFLGRGKSGAGCSVVRLTEGLHKACEVSEVQLSKRVVITKIDFPQKKERRKCLGSWGIGVSQDSLAPGTANTIFGKISLLPW